MKKIIAWPLCWGLFIFGDLMCRLIHVTPERLYISGMYQLYNKPMLWSVRLNDWAGLSLWSKPS
jgi:hypothetical protein